MATILESVDLSVRQRPVYSSYELSELVKAKRKKENKSVKEFAETYHVETKILEQIEEGERSFTPEIYKACSAFLEMPLKDVIAMEEDEVPSFRASNDNEEVRSTFNIANVLLDEIIMQKKVSARAYR